MKTIDTVLDSDDGVITLRLKPIPGVEDKFITETGEIFRLLKNTTTAHGHLNCYVSRKAHKSGNGQLYQNLGVHRAVALAWIGPSPFPGAVVRHLDGNPANNHKDNLAWGTQAENIADTMRHGRHVRGSKVASSKLDERKVRKILMLLEVGLSQVEIHRQLGISRSTINTIAKRKRWAHVKL